MDTRGERTDVMGDDDDSQTELWTHGGGGERTDVMGDDDDSQTELWTHGGGGGNVQT